MRLPGRLVEEPPRWVMHSTGSWTLDVVCHVYVHRASTLPWQSPAPPKARPSQGPKPRVVAQKKQRGAVAAAGKASPGPRRPVSGGGGGAKRPAAPRPPAPRPPSAPLPPTLPTGLKITIKNDHFQPKPQSGKVRLGMAGGCCECDGATRYSPMQRPSKFGKRR